MDHPMGAMLLSGFAGTGKTTLVRALIAGLAVIDFRPILAAPTGRAAKVLQGNTGVARLHLASHLVHLC